FVRAARALGFGALELRLAQREPEPEHEREHRGAPRGDREPMAPHELAEAVTPTAGTGEHRSVIEPAREVVGELAGRAGTAFRLERQRLLQDAVEVAVEVSAPRRDVARRQREPLGIDARAGAG